MTVISRSKVDHPVLGTAGGSGLYNEINSIYLQLGDQDNSRYNEFSSVADSTTQEIDHNFGSSLDELTVLLYTGTGTTKTQIIDFVDAGWVVAAKTGFEALILEVTTPSSGGPHDFTVIVLDGAISKEKLHQQVASSPANPAAANVLKEFWDDNGRGLALDSSGNVYTMQSLTPETITGATSATPGTLYKADTSGGALTITLPATIQDYDVIEVADLAKTFNSDNVTIARNGNSIDGDAADFTLNTKGQAVKLVGDAANSNWIVINSVAGDSAEGGTNYYTNGSFESDVVTGVTITQGATVTAETTSPLEGIQSALITQDNSATVADVRFAIDVSDSWVEEGGIVPLVEALVKADAADADGDVTFGIYNETDADWLYGPVDITGAAELNIIRASAAGALVDGKTYVGRILRTDSTDTREVLVDRLRLDPINGNAIIPEADATTLGLVKKAKRTFKISNYIAVNLSGGAAVFNNDFDISNLEIGRTYRIITQIGLRNEVGSSAAVRFYDGSTNSGNIRHSNIIDETSGSVWSGQVTNVSEFVATTTTLWPTWQGDTDADNGITLLSGEPHNLEIIDITDQYVEGGY